MTSLKRIALLTIVMALACAGTAHAGNLGAKGGFTYVNKTQKAPASSEYGVGNVAAVCPNGALPVGGGLEIKAPASSAVIAGSSTASGGTWYGQAWSFGLQEKREVTSWAICSKKMKQEYESSTSLTYTGTIAAQGKANCPAGLSTTGGGVFLNSSASNWQMTMSRPANGLDGDSKIDDAWVTGLRHRVGSSDTVFPRVECLPGETKIVQEETSGKEPVKAKALCPASKSVTGGGWEIVPDEDGFGWSTASKPIDSKADKDKVPDDGWQVNATMGDDQKRDVVVYAACR